VIYRIKINSLYRDLIETHPNTYNLLCDKTRVQMFYFLNNRTCIQWSRVIHYFVIT